MSNSNPVTETPVEKKPAPKAKEAPKSAHPWDEFKSMHPNGTTVVYNFDK
jgi:hypothetical protein